ncbi:MAG: DNA alkylation repair protein [Candidatus Marinimicrobia bacterium]|nr:DNA alkylation repair protein [Candidatus Neomarinimicrobiota bacterium]MCF7828600.1 DNA alkylation repair protein [Candidatus Neomarinimicrobiota bacterium]MCF7880341.1 DNA alkylation repair protein [Candidatus Neomarinimicrobiota bacterium]
MSMHPMVQYLIEEMERNRDPEKAKPMQAYMKTDQPFYGIQAKPRREIFRKAKRKFPIDSREEWEQVGRQLWTGEHREEMYMALEVAERYKQFRDEEAMPLFEYLAETAPHWDTLDWIAGKLISSLILAHREFESKLREWRESENLWMRRASLLAHLKHKEETNTELLAKSVLLLAHEDEFFIRKAIGWVLRDYSYANPDWVQEFVDKHAAELSGLSRREALKKINRDRKKQKTKQ